MIRIYPWVLIALLLAGPPARAEKEKVISLPPDSLAQWYKPANKRQVWLHTMFRLRREMLAVSDYLALEDGQRARKWAGRLGEDYRKIGEMVPEWSDELELEQLERLQQAIARGEQAKAVRAFHKLGMSCSSCHKEYRAVAALLYRSPNFSEIRVEDSESLEELPYKKVMGRLSVQVNRIKIASEDGRKATALEALRILRQGLEDLGESCRQCHQDPTPRQRFLGAGMGRALASLQQGVEREDKKHTGEAMGALAVQVCARCHAVHRTLSDMKGLLTD